MSALEQVEAEVAQISQVYDWATEFVLNYSVQILGAIIIIIFGILVARKISNIVEKVCLRNNIDSTLSRFLSNLTRLVVIILITLVALTKLGISITPIIATIGALSLGAGLAIQGLVANYGAGLNIVFTRPFKLGDTIQVQGVKGIVTDIRLAYTILEDEDGVDITIPNKHIMGEIIHNSHDDTLIESIIGVAYHTDIDHAITAISSGLKNISGINTSENRAPIIGIENFGDSAINIGIRCWVPTSKVHELQYQINKTAFDAISNAGIEIPYPHAVIEIKKD